MHTSTTHWTNGGKYNYNKSATSCTLGAAPRWGEGITVQIEIGVELNPSPLTRHQTPTLHTSPSQLPSPLPDLNLSCGGRTK